MSCGRPVPARTTLVSSWRGTREHDVHPVPAQTSNEILADRSSRDVYVPLTFRTPISAERKRALTY
jgi:hypothetical protein